MRALITTVPFGDLNRAPIELLQSSGLDYVFNPIGRKLKENELADIIESFDILIAGTEPITEKVISRGKNLKLISRVGVGLDSVDLNAAKRRNIKVSYTPDAPAPAVADLTIGLIYSLLRSIHIANAQMHQGKWQRHFGRRISEVTVGVIGAGRIGGRVLSILQSLGVPRILVNDIDHKVQFSLNKKFEFVNKDTIYSEADVISLHVPMSGITKNMINHKKLLMMKRDAVIINTARGGIINEHDLAGVLNSGHLQGAAIDVFDREPYEGALSKIDRCLMTSHMGSMSIDCRANMEIEATKEALRFMAGLNLCSLVPPEEYEIQHGGIRL